MSTRIKKDDRIVQTPGRSGDFAGNSWVLDAVGTVLAGEERTVRWGGQPMAMNNTCDTIDLLDADGQLVDSVTYGMVAEGEFVITN